MWIISLPLSVAVSSKKNFRLNINTYRNAHFHVLSNAKVEFTRVVSPLLKLVPKLNSCTLEYVHYPKSRRANDTNNVCSIVDKFFADVLVTCGVLDDDDRTRLTRTTFSPGPIDRDRPRVDVVISSAHVIHERNRNMKAKAVFEVEPDEVQEALSDFFRKKYPQLDTAEKLTFTPVANGSYEIRTTFDFSKVAAISAPGASPKAQAPATADSPPASPKVAPEAAEEELGLPPGRPKRETALFEDFIKAPK